MGIEALREFFFNDEPTYCELTVKELIDEVKAYQSEHENPSPCHVMKETHRNKMFHLVAKLEESGPEWETIQ